MNDSISLGVRLAILLLVGWKPFTFKTWCWIARRLEFSGSEKVGNRDSTCWGRDDTIWPEVVFSCEKKNHTTLVGTFDHVEDSIMIRDQVKLKPLKLMVWTANYHTQRFITMDLYLNGLCANLFMTQHNGVYDACVFNST